MKSVLGACLLAILLSSVVATAQEDAPAPVKPALLVIDVQRQYVPMMDASEEESATRYINGAIWYFRQHGLPVIRVYHTDPQHGPAPDSEAFEFVETIQVQEDDPKVVKHHGSAFVDTELDALLEEMGANTLFLCGLSATGCVLATYFGAQERGYDVFMIEGALLSPRAPHTEAVQEIVHTVGFPALRTILNAAAPR